MQRKAFTLIELLVVIAIIAILAAILFPVFAQAKAAAKSAVTLSNQKQVNLAGQMYIGDVDDTYFPRGTMNGNGASWANGACSASTFGCPSWNDLLFPYMKSVALVESAFDRTPAIFIAPGQKGKRSFRVAGNVIHGWAGNNTWDGGNYGYTPTNASAVPAPAGTLLLTEQRNPAYKNCTWWEGAAWQECGVWWASSPNTLSNDDPVAWSSADTAIRYTDGIDFANASKAAYGFADGHVKTSPKGFIFPGYERRKGAGQPIDNTLKGVCIDGGAFAADANDCVLPQ